MYDIIYHREPLHDKAFLITGGAGFIGSNLVEYLLKHGAGKVRVLDNLSTGFADNLSIYKDIPAFEFYEGDITNTDTCRKACEGITHISHQAALGSVPRSIANPLKTHEVNVTGFLNMLIAARDAGVKRFVYASSSSVYGDHPGLPKQEDLTGHPLSPYAVTKATNELYARVFGKLYGMETLGLRYFNVFGPRQSPTGPYAAVIPLFVQALLDGKSPIIHGDGGQTRDFTFVENAVQANVKAMLTIEPSAFNEVFNIAVGQRVSLLLLWEELQQLTNTTLAPSFVESRTGDVRDSLANISKAALLMDYSPEFTLRAGLQIALAWYKARSYK